MISQVCSKSCIFSFRSTTGNFGPGNLCKVGEDVDSDSQIPDQEGEVQQDMHDITAAESDDEENVPISQLMNKGKNIASNSVAPPPLLKKKNN